MISTDLHPALKPLAFLLGTWRGDGEGDYPTVMPFRYREEIRFSHNGKPFLIYNQRTESPETGQPMHAESGYLRSLGDGAVEFVIAQPIGFAEISVGRVTGTRIDVASDHVARTPTAKAVTAISRSFWLENDCLHYETRMAMETQPMTSHLRATFQRVG